MYGFKYQLQHVCSFSATLAPPTVVGPVPEGIRAIFSVTGGPVTGPKVRGKLRAEGGDWLTMRADGVCVLDVRATVETHDGALIYVAYSGVADFGEDGYQRFLRGELPAVLAIRVAPRFSTAHPDYLWVNRLQCIGIGEFHSATNSVDYDIYALA